MNNGKQYLLGLLTIILTLNYTERVALGMAAQNVKVDLSLSDTQLGLLSGIAFALFYSVMGIPIARWADRGNRVTIIWLSTALWSATVALCGIARSFLQLLLMRVVVGVGEAGCIPPAHSLIADFFTRAERPRAVSLYMQGVAVSSVIGYFVAGWLNQFYGWRAMFVLIALPGFVLAAVARFTLREPRRGSFTVEAAASLPSPLSTKDVCASLWARATFRHVLCGFSVTCFFSSGTTQWGPVFFVRSFGLQTGELGTWFAVVVGLGSVVGTYLGGEWAARCAANNERLQLYAMAILICLSGIFAAFAYLPVLAPNYYWAFGWLALSNAAAAATNGPTFGVLQTLVPARMRAMSIALVLLFINLVGSGLGPWAVGALSDGLRPWASEESMRYAMLLMCPVCLWGTWHLWSASRVVAHDLKIDETESAARSSAAQQRADSGMISNCGSLCERSAR